MANATATEVPGKREARLDFEWLAGAHRDGVYRQMLRLCGNREDAEDVLTDALLAAYRKMDTLREREAFGAWLAQIARRLCFHLHSQQKIRAALSLDEMEAHGAEPAEAKHARPDELLLAHEVRSAIQSTVSALPKELREVYVLRDLEEVNGDAAAEQLGITRAAMKSRLHRARSRVRARMDELFVRGASRTERSWR